MLKKLPTGLIVSSLILLLFGLVMIASATVQIAHIKFGIPLYYFWKQCSFMGIGISVAILISFVPMQIWQNWKVQLLLLGVCFVAWLLNFSVIELLILVMILYLVRYVTHTPLKDFLTPLIILSLFSCIILLEPHYGMFVVLLTLMSGVLLSASIPRFQFLLWIMALSLIILCFSYFITLTLSWINPFLNGELLGVGLGNSLHANHSSIFALIAEELGVMGVIGVITLFAILIYHIFTIGMCTKHQNCFYLAKAIGLYLGIQGIVGMLGLHLPFMNYGASSVIVICMMLALLSRIDYETYLLDDSKERRKELLKLSKLGL